MDGDAIGERNARQVQNALEHLKDMARPPWDIELRLAKLMLQAKLTTLSHEEAAALGRSIMIQAHKLGPRQLYAPAYKAEWRLALAEFRRAAKDFMRATARRPAKGFPRLWELLAFALGKETRRRVYEPVRQELLEDYVRAARYRTKWSRRWLGFCFTLRTILLVLGCIRAASADKTVRFLLRFIPKPLKEWWVRNSS